MEIQKTQRGKILITSDSQNGEEYSIMSETAFNELKAYLMDGILNRLCEMQNIAWADDDIMDQDNLFELQNRLADLTLSVASKISPVKVDYLVKMYPWLYEVKGE